MVVLSGRRGEHPLEHGGKRGPVGVAAGSHKALTVALKDACANGMTHGVLGPGGDVGGITEQPQGPFGQRLFFILGVAVEEAGHLFSCYKVPAAKGAVGVAGSHTGALGPGGGDGIPVGFRIGEGDLHRDFGEPSSRHSTVMTVARVTASPGPKRPPSRPVMMPFSVTDSTAGANHSSPVTSGYSPAARAGAVKRQREVSRAKSRFLIAHTSLRGCEMLLFFLS